MRLDYSQKSTTVLKRQGGNNGRCHTHGWIWVQAQVCGHLRRQVCLNNMKRAQLRAGCTSDTVIALTFLKRHFYVALQSVRYKGLRSSERESVKEEEAYNVPFVWKLQGYYNKMLRRWRVIVKIVFALFNSAWALQSFLSKVTHLTLCVPGAGGAQRREGGLVELGRKHAVMLSPSYFISVSHLLPTLFSLPLPFHSHSDLIYRHSLMEN